MCGLAGFISLNTRRRTPDTVKKTFVNLFLTSQLRGFHSSGVAMHWRQDPRVHVIGKKKRKPRVGWALYKGLDGPSTAMKEINAFINRRTERNDKTHQDWFPTVALGHSRHATLGAITEDNAHPFSYFNGRFIGTHNGTITNARYVFNQLEHDADIEPLPNTFPAPEKYGDPEGKFSDSEIVLYCIYRYGIEAVYPKIHGAWALVWYDQSNGQVHFIRNNQRTLFFYWTPSQDSIFWSSESMMMEFAVRRELTLYNSENKGRYDPEKCELLTPHTLYTVDITNPRTMPYTTKAFPFTRKQPLNKLRETKTTTGDNRNFDDSYWQGWLQQGDGDKDWYDKRRERRMAAIDRADARAREAERKRNLPVIGQGKQPPVIEHKPANNAQPAFLKRSLIPSTLHAPAASVPSTEDDDPKEDDCRCMWCSAKLEKPKDSSTFYTIKSTSKEEGGKVCFECAGDVDIVATIMEAYPHIGDDPEWVNLWFAINDKKETKL